MRCRLPKETSDESELSEKQRDQLDERQVCVPEGAQGADQRREPRPQRDRAVQPGEGVSDDERDAAWKRIKKAADKDGVEVNEKSWRELGKK